MKRLNALYNVLKGSLGLIFVTLTLLGCSKGGDSGVLTKDLYDVSGVYNVNNKAEAKVNVLEINHSDELKSVSVRLVREGLSDAEINYFVNNDLYHWADSALGRELRLGSDNFDFQLVEQQNSKSGQGDVVLSACSKTMISNRPSLTFVYCLEGNRKFGSENLTADLLLHVLKEGVIVKTITTKINAFTNQRWSSQYLGYWQGLVDIFSAHRQDLNIQTGDVFNYDLLTRGGRYYFQPKDLNRLIVYKGERFILHPDEPAISDLEESTAPYFNFRYWSEESGERRLEFNGHFKGSNRIEGNITFYRGRGSKLKTLGTYVMEKK